MIDTASGCPSRGLLAYASNEVDVDEMVVFVERHQERTGRPTGHGYCLVSPVVAVFDLDGNATDGNLLDVGLTILEQSGRPVRRTRPNSDDQNDNARLGRVVHIRDARTESFATVVVVGNLALREAPDVRHRVDGEIEIGGFPGPLSKRWDLEVLEIDAVDREVFENLRGGGESGCPERGHRRGETDGSEKEPSWHCLLDARTRPIPSGHRQNRCSASQRSVSATSGANCSPASR